jgi:LEA14-like dessication related protein
VLGAASAAACLLLVWGCSTLAMATFRRPEMTFRGIEVYSLGLEGADLDLLVDVYNPNGFDFGLDRVTYDLTVEKVRWGKGETASPLSVGANSTTTLRLPLTLDWTQISGLGRDVMRRGTVRYGVSGNVTVSTSKKTFQVPYDRSGSFSIYGSDERN